MGTTVPFNAKAGRFGDNKEARESFLRIHEKMRDGIGIPEGGGEYIVGPWLSFDPETEKFVGDHAKEANVLLKDPNNTGFEVPELKDV